MSSYRRQISLGIFTAVAAALTWAAASGSVENYPATVRYNINLPGETLTGVAAHVYVNGGPVATRSIGGPITGPFEVDVTVNGGDPARDDDPVISYQPFLYATFVNPASASTYLRINKEVAFPVTNTPSQPSVTVPTSFTYSAVRRGNVSVNVVGPATIASYSLLAGAFDGAGGERFYAETAGTTNLQTSVTTWVAMAPRPNVSFYGYVTLRNPDGTTVQRSLTTQIRDLTSSDAAITWTIDLTNLGHLEGGIGVLSAPPGTTTNSFRLRYTGVSAATSGIVGTVILPPTTTRYAVDLAPGDYDLSLYTLFDSPTSSSEGARRRVTIAAGAAGANADQDFYRSYGKARLDVTIGGFFTTAGLASLQSVLQLPPVGSQAFSSARVGNGVEQVVPFGTWKSEYTYLTLYDNSTPLHPLDNRIYHYHYNDTDTPPTEISSPGTTTVGHDKQILVRTNLYLDVNEPTGAVQVSSPQLYGIKTDLNSNGSRRSQSVVYAYGSSTPQLVSGFTVVGEPGTYTITTTGAFNNQRSNFGRPGATLTFGTPVVTPPSPPQEPGDPPPPRVVVPLSEQTTGDHLNVSIAFEHVGGAGGVTTLVESPLGPEPPEGYRMSCIEDPGVPCDPIYYDITTNADWSGGSAKLCVRRTSRLYNAAAELYLKLFRYSASEWLPLPDPADGSPAFVDCSADFAACGCTSEADCGIESGDDYFTNAYLLCGEIDAATVAALAANTSNATTSSPPQPGTVAILQGRSLFTNKVDGIEYTGPNGPASGLQHFVAPSAGTYRITASGARGAKPTAPSSYTGGCGAELAGDFPLQEGDTLDILVGQMGTAAANSGGGGGGTFVVKNGVPLLVAGGGGGIRSGTTSNGRGGALTLDGRPGSTSNGYSTGFVPGGSAGGGGSRAVSFGSGGGGWSGNGATDSSYGDGGFAFTSANQGKGGSGKTCSGGLAHGGYGGGGAGNGYGGGGGGGYSGGGGGRVAGGGGSLNTGANQHNLDGNDLAACTETGHGQVVIELL